MHLLMASVQEWHQGGIKSIGIGIVSFQNGFSLIALYFNGIYGTYFTGILIHAVKQG